MDKGEYMSLKICYVNTWGGFETETCFFSRVIKEIDPKTEFHEGYNSSDYDLVISLMPNTIHGNQRVDLKNIKNKKLCFTGESYPIFEHTPFCDAYIGFDYEEDVPKDLKYMRYPLYTLYHYDHLNRYNVSSFEELRNKFIVKNPKKKFSAVVSNPNNRFRKSLIEHLVRNNFCDSGGAVANNIGEIGWSFDAKMNLCASCMYGIAFENVQKKGYITEKIYEALMVGAVPYYWGAPDITQEFNPNSYFIFDASSQEKANQSLQEMTQRLEDLDLFETMRNVDPFTGFKSEKYIKNGKEIMKNFILEVLNTK